MKRRSGRRDRERHREKDMRLEGKRETDCETVMEKDVLEREGGGERRGRKGGKEKQRERWKEAKSHRGIKKRDGGRSEGPQGGSRHRDQCWTPGRQAGQEETGGAKGTERRRELEIR